MKIVYNDSTIEKNIEEFASSLGVEIELRKDLEETIKEMAKASKGRPIGCPIPDSFIDLGKYLFAFFLGSVTSGITYDLIKISIKKLLCESRSKTIKKFDEFIISNGSDQNNFKENIYFFIPISLSEAELNICLDEINKIIDRTKELQNFAYLSGSLRFYYVDANERSYYQNKRFVLKEIVKDII